MNLRKKPQSPQRRPRSSRSRTPLNTYYRADAKSDGASPFKAKPDRTGYRRYVFFLLDFLVVIILLAGLGYSLLISPSPKVLASSQAFHNTQDYQAYADQLFSRLQNRNKITFDDISIAKAMQKKFPEIMTVSTELPIFSEKPTVRITVASAALRIRNSGVNYIVDSQGVVVGRAASLPASQSLPQVIDQSGFRTGPGRPLLSAGAVSFIRVVSSESAAAKAPISSLTLPPVAQELDLRTKDRPYYVKFYLGGDALSQSGQFLATRHYFDKNNQQPAEYLDVRVAGKIFYK